VCDLETSNEEAKARYGAVENTTKRVVTPRKRNVTADTTWQYTPGYIFHDANTPTFGATLTVAVATAYENCKIVNMQRPWKYYRRMYKNLSGSTATNSRPIRGYLPTAEPLATQRTVLFGINSMTASHQLGQFLVTLYAAGTARN
jgi:hypothetical protein